ncbi:MAG: sigma-70 family RNA polymerase sigma factor [Romboutsia sp.]
MDNEIIKLIKSKDQKGLDLLIDLYSKNIYYIVESIMRGYCSKEDIEECVSDVFLKIWDEIDELEYTKGSLKTFILIKAKYKALDYKRKIINIEKKKLVSIDTFNILGKYDIEEMNIKEEKLKKLINIIKVFKEPDKTYFYLRYFMDYDINSIANKFNDTRSGVENRLYRSRLKVKKLLGEE